MRPTKEDDDVQNRYTAVIQREGDWWIGWIEEIPGVNCQEATKEELLETLRVTLAEAIELNRAEALRDVAADYVEEPVLV
jgi:predicted RNase H-like HicB family nuclease